MGRRGGDIKRCTTQWKLINKRCAILDHRVGIHVPSPGCKVFSEITYNEIADMDRAWSTNSHLLPKENHSPTLPLKGKNDFSSMVASNCKTFLFQQVTCFTVIIFLQASVQKLTSQFRWMEKIPCISLSRTRGRKNERRHRWQSK